ncbi:TetR/AcrR family transcriptional regulator [Mycobacterium sp. C31M]
MTEPGRVYGGIPAAQRRTDRRQRLFDAGLALFAERGIASVTVGEICQKAGLIKRYFYEQFDSIDTFVDALMDDLVEEQLTPEPPGEPGPERLRARIMLFIDAVTADPRLARFVLVETFGATGSLTRLRNRLVHNSVEIMMSEFPPTSATTPADKLSMQMSAYALAGACSELTLAWVEGQINAGADEIADHIAALFESASLLPAARRTR